MDDLQHEKEQIEEIRAWWAEYGRYVIAGVVISINVSVGAEVTDGTPVATLEAMKTKTIVSAGRSGKVSEIAVAIGDAVEPGQPLLTID